MVNRPAGGARSVRHKREPFDWYCEGPEPVDQLLDAIDFGRDLIWDPSCGRGNILDVAKRRGHETFGSDLVERVCPIRRSPILSRHPFFQEDFLRNHRPPIAVGEPFSIICNPPYGYQPRIAEAFVRHALTFPVKRAAFLLPVAFMCAEERWRLFARDCPPSHIAIVSQRPTCPPGSTLTGLTTFKGGMADYIWLVFTQTSRRRRTETIWLKPST